MIMKAREIAARIAAQAPEYPTKINRPDNDSERARFAFGTLRLSCMANQEAVLAMAHKYERGLYFHTARTQVHRLSKHPGMKRPPDADALLAALFAECGEEVQP
jgi:hypothetical protein